MPLNPNIILNQRPVPTPMDFRAQALQQRQAQQQQQLTQIKLDEAQRQQQDRQAVDDAYTQGGGVRDKVLASLPGHLVPEVGKWFDEQDRIAAQAKDARAKADEAELKFAGGLAAQIRASNYNPQIADLALQYAEEHGHDVGQFRQLLQANPEQFKAVVDGIAERGGFKAEKTATEQFTLSPGSKRFDPTGKVIAEVPAAERAAAAQGFTLAPGATRYDADGKVIAKAPERPTSGSGAAGPKPKSVTSSDANKIADLNNALRDLDALAGTIQDVKGATGPAAAAGAALPNFITSMTGIGTQAKEKQAMIDRVKQVIGKSLEGGVLRKEDEDKYRKILPVISDVPEVVTAKLTGLQEAIERKRDEQLSSLEDAGYDTSRYRAREGAAKSTAGTKAKKVGRFTVEVE